jgi:hypothetical protein
MVRRNGTDATASCFFVNAHFRHYPLFALRFRKRENAPMEMSSRTSQTNESSVLSHLLLAVIFVWGVQRLVFRDDIPLGILQVSMPFCAVVRFLRKGDRTVAWGIRIALVAGFLAAGIAEIVMGRMIEGIAVLGLAPLVVWAWRYGRRHPGSIS